MNNSNKIGAARSAPLSVLYPGSKQSRPQPISEERRIARYEGTSRFVRQDGRSLCNHPAKGAGELCLNRHAGAQHRSVPRARARLSPDFGLSGCDPRRHCASQLRPNAAWIIGRSQRTAEPRSTGARRHTGLVGQGRAGASGHTTPPYRFAPSTAPSYPQPEWTKSTSLRR